MKKKIFLPFFSLAALFLSFFFSYLYFNQDNLLFQHHQVDLSIPYSSSHQFEELYFNTKDNGRLHAIHFKVHDPKGIVVYFHGRGGNLIEHWKKLPDDFLSRSYEVLALDYRNFGKSRGRLSEKALLEDAELIYQYALNLFSPQQIVLYGKSLGTSIATYVASKYPSKHLILESPYYSMVELACEKYYFLPKTWISSVLKYKLLTNEWIQKVLSPVTIFHGDKDELIPFSASHKLYDLIKDTHQVTLTIIPGGKHSNLPKFKQYQKNLSNILE